jgi:hypothetical protein
MSLAANYFRGATKFTVWRKSAPDPQDPHAGAAWSRVGAFNCTYEDSPKLQKDNDGRMFKPSAAFYTKESNVIRGDMVLQGDIAGDTPSDLAREVVHIKTAFPMLGTPDYDVFTG